MVHTVDPVPGKTIYDPGCGTGGFLAIAYEHIARKLGPSATSTDIDTLKHDTFSAGKRKTWSFPSPWPIWFCTASTSPTSGTAIP